MAAVKSQTTPKRRRPGPWGLGPWSILILVSACFAVLSGCASTSQAPLARPQLQLSETLKTGAACDGLRGRLPTVAELDVAAMANGWEDAEAFGTCQQDRANQLVGIALDFEAAWERYEHGDR